MLASVQIRYHAGRKEQKVAQYAENDTVEGKQTESARISQSTQHAERVRIC